MHEAKVTGKPVMVDFGATWCTYCKMLDQQTYSDPRVIRSLQGWIAARVDVDKEPELAEKYGATSLPSVLFFRSNGQPAAGFQGFVAPNDMLAVLPRARAIVQKPSSHVPTSRPRSQEQAS
jgi:thiol:disulfide interchange protein